MVNCQKISVDDKKVLLKSIRESAGKLLIDGTDQQAFQSIKNHIDKGVNYSFYVLSKLLDFQSKNVASLSSEALKAIFELIELAIFTNSANADKDAIIIKLKKFIESKQVSFMMCYQISIRVNLQLLLVLHCRIPKPFKESSKFSTRIMAYTLFS